MEMVFVLVDVLFGGEKVLIIINFFEYQELYIVSQLKGFLLGYVGYGQGGILIEVVCKCFYSVVLFDEVEKVYCDVMNLFYQVFDWGVMCDGEGCEIDFCNIVILMIVNFGSDFLMQLLDEQLQVSELDLYELLCLVLCGYFQLVLLVCFQMVIYCLLLVGVLCVIVGMKFGQVSQCLVCYYGIIIIFSESLFVVLIEVCLLLDIGVCNVDSLLNQQILLVLSQQLLSYMVVGQKLCQVMLGYYEEEGVVMVFDEGIIFDEQCEIVVVQL